MPQLRHPICISKASLSENSCLMYPEGYTADRSNCWLINSNIRGQIEKLTRLRADHWKYAAQPLPFLPLMHPSIHRSEASTLFFCGTPHVLTYRCFHTCHIKRINSAIIGNRHCVARYNSLCPQAAIHPTGKVARGLTAFD